MHFKIHKQDLAFNLFKLVFIVNAITAYEVFRMPIPWFSVLFLTIAVVIIPKIIYQSITSKGGIVFFILIVYSLLITVYNWGGEYSAKPTTPYAVFIILRYLSFFEFFIGIGLAIYLAKNGYKDRIILFWIYFGFIIALYALYVYFAHIFGLPEVPRTRLGTGGQDYLAQKVQFTGGINRALGSFREPSHLAEWLIIPIILSFSQVMKKKMIIITIIFSAFLLTLSLTGYLALVVALVFYFFVSFFKIDTRRFYRGFVFIVGLVGVFYVLSNTGYGELVLDRLNNLMAGGVDASNRSYVYNYLRSTEIPFFGQGLGNSNLIFSQFLYNSGVSSFISLYVNTLMSIGVVGLLLLVIFFSRILIEAVIISIKDKMVLVYSAAFIAWLAIFGMHSETVRFEVGVLIGLLVYQLSLKSKTTQC